MGFLQYLKDTRGELRHVAWPTNAQTMIFTVLVIVLSIIAAFYLGFFDYVFTTGLSGTLELLQGAPSIVTPDSTSVPPLPVHNPMSPLGL